jgi:hypothetical protein
MKEDHFGQSQSLAPQLCTWSWRSCCR